MRIFKEKAFLVAASSLFLTIFGGLFLFISFVSQFKALDINNVFIMAGLIMYFGFAIISSLISGLLLIGKINNVKRERSALIMGLVFSPFLFTAFVLLNAYRKSGLSKYQKDEAIKIITMKHMREILNRKEVKNFIKQNQEFASKIENVTKLRDKNYESEIYSNENFYDILSSYEVKTGFKLNDQEVIEIGKYL